MKIFIEADVEMDVVYIGEPHDTEYSGIYEVPEELYKKWCKAFDDFANIQEEIRDFTSTYKW